MRSLCTEIRLIDSQDQVRRVSLPLAETDRAMLDEQITTPLQQAAADDILAADNHNVTPPPNPYQPLDPTEEVVRQNAPPATRIPGYDPKQDASGIPDPTDINPDPVLTDELAKALRRAQTNSQQAREKVRTH